MTSPRVLVLGLPDAVSAAARARGLKVVAVLDPEEADGIAFSAVAVDGTRAELVEWTADRRSRGRPEAIVAVGGDARLARLADVILAANAAPDDVATALARRATEQQVRWLRVGDRLVDLTGLRILGESATDAISEQEAGLLAALAVAGDEGRSRDELQRTVWGARVVTRAVDQAVARLRPKLEVDAREPRHLVTVRGQGYALFAEILPGPPSTLPAAAPPAPPSPLVAADAVLAALTRAWDAGAPLVAVYGPPGSGKSSLARAFARSVGPVAALDLSAGQVPPIPSGVVLLDDADAVDAPLLSALSPRLGRDVRVIWTSCAPPALTVAVSVPTTPWTVDDARTVAAALRADEPGLDALLAFVVDRSHGNALAIGLSLARLDVMSPAALVDRLSHGAAALGDPTRRPARHRRYVDAVDVAWSALSADSRAALVGVACGSTSTPDALAAVARSGWAPGGLSPFLAGLLQARQS